MAKEIADTRVTNKSGLWIALPVVALIGISMISGAPRTAIAQAVQLCRGFTAVSYTHLTLPTIYSV